MTTTWARRWHLLTAVVAVAALLLQLVLVAFGSAVLVDTDPPGLSTRLGRFVSYFTVQSNLLVAIATITLARDPARDGEWWRVVRAAGVVGITVTGLVHFFLLRPLLHLEGWNYVADKLLHMAVPLLAFVGWALFGPRPRIDGRSVARALIWPIAWLVETLLVGQLSGWYPYPFLDVDLHGWGRVLVASVGVAMLFFACFGAAALADRRWSPRPRER